uniref:Hypersensitive-induced response protein 4-like n=1 Tax=Nicotiana tabacum TaxID=4097 RepID=A0A1S4CUP9_TOBAC|nr:PREDICTED: hypersensitive-induced response protein 4-like [Nicotiana tabacum]
MGNANCVFCGCIEQASVGVVEKWGRFDRLAEPGLNFFNPFAGECLSGILSTRISSLDVKIETKTKLLVTILILVVSKFTPVNAIFAQMFIVSHKSQITCL